MGELVTGRMFVLPAAVTVALLAPAVASADTITVDPAASSGCANDTCKTLRAAHDSASPGDTIVLKSGVYEEGGLDLTKANLTIKATPGAVSIASSGTENGTDVLTVSGDGITLEGLIIGVRDNGGSALHVAGAGTVIDTVALQNRVNADQPALDVTAASGVTTVRDSRINHEPNLDNPSSTPAVRGPSGSALLIEDTTIISGEETGPAVALPGGGTLIRSSLLAENSGADALSVTSAATSTAAKSVRVDSSVLSGGTGAAGLHVVTQAAPSGSNAGDVGVELVRVTIAGAARSIDVDALANSVGLLNPPPKGSVEVRAERSIVHGEVTVENVDGGLLPLLTGGNTAKVSISDSDSPAQAFSETGSLIEVSGNQSSTDEQLFSAPAARLYLLRPGSPAIDKGGPVRDGESTKDFEGEERQLGPATDLGADEFSNKPPTARLEVTPNPIRQDKEATLDASKSVDPEQAHGGGIAQYVWDFGDGTTETTTTPTVKHVFKAVGTFDARVTVTDPAGLSATSPVVAVRVLDGVKPEVTITEPKNGKRFNRVTRKRVGGRTRTTVNRIRFAGTASDAQGIRRVDVNFQLGGRSGVNCKFLDVKRGRIITRRCSAPPYYRVAIRGDKWAYRSKATTKFGLGLYKLTVAATDNSGVIGIASTRFRIK